MLGVLLLKDLRRARRNPTPYLIHLAVPLVITALLGLVFGGSNGSGGGTGGGLGRIRLVLVDEDATPLTGLFRGALNQGQAAERFEVTVRGRDDALRLVTNNQVAAALIIPTGFTRGYLLGQERVRWELVKNPAQQFHPAIVEEMMGLLTAGLNAVGRNLRPDLEEWRRVLDGGTPVTARAVGEALIHTGERVDVLRHRLVPLPVWYAEEAREKSSGTGSGGGGFQVGNMFAYLLPGLMAMFMLFLAEVALRDLDREIGFRTFQRYATLPPGPFLFVLSKVVLAWAILAIGATVLLGGGSLLFGFRWRHPGTVAALALGLALFAGGFMAVTSSLLRSDGRAHPLGSVVAMLLALASGCTFPAQALPGFLRDHVTPRLPPAWFIEGVRASQFSDALEPSWPVVLKLVILGLFLTAIAAGLLKRAVDPGRRVWGLGRGR